MVCKMKNESYVTTFKAQKEVVNCIISKIRRAVYSVVEI